MKYKEVLGTMTFLCVTTLMILSACSKSNEATTYEYAPITRGSLEKTVSSSGKLQPISTVNISSQMNGKIELVNVDYNDTITKGQILAELNTDMLQLEREPQIASVTKARAKLELQPMNYNNQLALAEKDLISEYELKSSKTSLDAQIAELSSAESSLKTIETEINQYAYIISPIDGIVLENNISVGQNVVEGSSSNASSLFVLAEDLTGMQIEANVDELDIASIYKGQTVRFNLEALPGKSFSGTVDTIHLMPGIVDNVVAYTVIIDVDNTDGSLFPGMTCEVEFIVEQRENVLLAPNASLRYQPTTLTTEEIADKVFYAGLEGMSEEEKTSAIAAHEQAKENTAQSNVNARPVLGGMGMVMRIGGGGRNRNQGTNGNNNTVPETRSLWSMNDAGVLETMIVEIGISDGSFTEIITDKDLEGKMVINRERIL
jgi:HlyD family secretion protein